LHRLVYLALRLASILVLWYWTSSYSDASFYGAIALCLLGMRVYFLRRKRQARSGKEDGFACGVRKRCDGIRKKKPRKNGAFFIDPVSLTPWRATCIHRCGCR